MSQKLSLFYLLVFFLPFFMSAQEGESLPDSLYREDQIYFGFTYNILSGSPNAITGSQFSGGFHTGFIRDFPLNERRNVALGIGLGWSIDTYGHNLFIGERADSEETIFQILNRNVIEFDKNRFSTQSVDVPIQFRWRTSTPESYKFWRVYTGLRPSYVYYFRSKFVQPGNTVIQTDVPELNRFRLGATFNFGYNTFNFHFYYSLNSFFDDKAFVEGENIDLKTFQVGLIFYLL
ncbi:porin family protein [Salinimicrobium flavum]|uniref:Porin family protein n=1 Tax=Salinimicrobium flavum TaxID=1737065 RepID=A0ABW5IY44_9FLAO